MKTVCFTDIDYSEAVADQVTEQYSEHELLTMECENEAHGENRRDDDNYYKCANTQELHDILAFVLAYADDYCYVGFYNACIHGEEILGEWYKSTTYTPTIPIYAIEI